MNLMTAMLLALAAQEETVEVPGTKLKFQLLPVPGKNVKLGKHEVTWELFNAYSGDENKSNLDFLKVDGITRPSRARSYFGQVQCPPHFLDDRGRPTINVRVIGAISYCDWLSKLTGRRFRLPTEAEWEFACRAGSDKEAPGDLDETAWHAGNSEERTHAVGEKKPNAFGFHDMLGNVWEYCLDSDTPPAYNPVVRGGSWKVPAAKLQFGLRQTIPRDWYQADPQNPKSSWWLTSDFTQGFRVACVDGASAADLKTYAPKIEIKVQSFKEVKPAERPALGSFSMQVTGQLTNTGTRTIQELDLTVYYLDSEGKPHLLDVRGADKPGRATFGRCHPVMVAFGKGDVARPLKPGETRAWIAELPMSFDVEPDEVNKSAFGARVEALVFAP